MPQITIKSPVKSVEDVFLLNNCISSKLFTYQKKCDQGFVLTKVKPRLIKLFQCVKKLPSQLPVGGVVGIAEGFREGLSVGRNVGIREGRKLGVLLGETTGKKHKRTITCKCWPQAIM